MQELPDYFMADLPAGTAVGPELVREACLALRRNRQQYLAIKSTDQMISLLANVAQDWLEEDFLFRVKALAEADKLGVTKEVLAAGINSFFSEITTKNLRALLLQDLGHLDRLEKFCSTEIELAHDRASYAVAPEFIVHLGRENFHLDQATSLVLGLLMRSAQLFVLMPETSMLLRLLAHSIYQREPKVGACIEIAQWTDLELDKIAAEQSDLLVTSKFNAEAQGPRVITYHDKISFAYIAREALQGSNPLRLAREAANDISAWNQTSGHAPHVIYVEHGGSLEVSKFAELLSEALHLREQSHPRGVVRSEEASAIKMRREFYETRAGSSERTKLWNSQFSTAWTVIFEADPLFQESCLHRFIYVKAATSVTEVIHAAESVRGRISTVAVEASDQRAPEIAGEFAKWGVDRICKLGQMQAPPLLFRRNGRLSLASMVRWTDWERS